jgi:hypothetical protein
MTARIPETVSTWLVDWSVGKQQDLEKIAPRIKSLAAATTVLRGAPTSGHRARNLMAIVPLTGRSHQPIENASEYEIDTAKSSVFCQLISI